jgi:hypothetical protein
VNDLNEIAMTLGGAILFPCLAMTLATGCAARVYSESEPAGVYAGPAEGDNAVVYVDTVPPNIEAYPHYYYGGGYAYYVDGRWYRRGPRGWGYYRQEPPQLEHQRAYFIQQAPAPAIRRERSEVERSPVEPREHREVERTPALPSERREAERPPAVPGERREVERAPADPRERPNAPQAPAEARPHPAVVEAQSPSREAPRRAPPANKRPAPPKEHER